MRTPKRPLCVAVLCLAIAALGACQSGVPEARGASSSPVDSARGFDLKEGTIVIQDHLEGARYQVNPAGIKILQSVLNREPDSVTPMAIPMFPSLTIVIGGARYQVQPHALVNLGSPGAIWKHPDLRQKLLSQSVRSKAN